MDKKYTLFYIIFSVIFLLLLITWTVIRFLNIQYANTLSAAERFENLKENVVSSYLARGTFDSD
ncbi:MAG: hypothetical protein AB1798_15965, partial [Spirochaetota bacterium]